MADNRAQNGDGAGSGSGRDKIELVADGESSAPTGQCTEQRPESRSGPRRALVRGAGGVLAAAWMTGALEAAPETLQSGLGDVDLMVGTSAGRVLAAALPCGVSTEERVP